MPSGNRLVGLSDEPSRRAGLGQYHPIRAEQYCNSAGEGGYSCIVVHSLSPFMQALQNTWLVLRDQFRVATRQRNLALLKESRSLTLIYRKSSSCGRIAGTWQWANGATVVIEPSGSASQSNSSGTWTCKEGQYVVGWSTGYTDRASLSTFDRWQSHGRGQQSRHSFLPNSFLEHVT
jgi:hypothetical protein